MELKLSEGQYALSDGRLETVQGAEETVQRVLMRLTARRGTFWPDPDYGSRLYALGRVRAAQRAAAARLYVAEALQDEQGVSVVGVTYTPGGDGSAAVTVTLSLDGSGRETAVTVEL